MADFGWHGVRVLECSQVRKPADFWALYVDRVKVQQAGLFGRNLDAFWDALTRGGPGVPDEPCFIEIRNHEALAAEHPVFVEKLVEIAAELKTLNGTFQVFFVEACSDVPLGGRRYQHDRFLSHEMKGTKLLSLLWADECLFVVCPGGVWQQMFLDAGIVFWGEYYGEELLTAYEPEELVDITARLGTGEHVLDSVEASRDGVLSLEITLMSGTKIRLDPVVPNDFDSDVELSIERTS